MKNLPFPRCLLRRMLLLAMLAILPAAHPSAQAAPSYEFIVNNRADREDATPGDGLCIGRSVVQTPEVPGRCTLRAAVHEVNTLSQMQENRDARFVIKIRPGTYQLQRTQTDAYDEQWDSHGEVNDLDLVARYVHIMGVGDDGTFPDAQERPLIRSTRASDGFRLFDVRYPGGGGEHLFSHLILGHSRGPAPAGGAAIYCRGGTSLTLEYTRVGSTTNLADGAVASRCDTYVLRSSIGSNTGNGIVMRPPLSGPVQLNVRRSSVTNNEASGIVLIPEYEYTGEQDVDMRELFAEVTSSTLSGNACGIRFYRASHLKLNGASIVENFVCGLRMEANPAYGEDMFHGYLDIANSLIANSGGPDLSRNLSAAYPASHLVVTNFGHNYIDKITNLNFPGMGSDFIAGGVLEGMQPVFLDYSYAFRPPADSPLIESGSDAPFDQIGACTTTDQSANSRGYKCDIGALEHVYPMTLPDIDLDEPGPSIPGDLPPLLPESEDELIFRQGFE